MRKSDGVKRATVSRPGSMPGGSSGILVYEMSAISAIGIVLAGVPRTETTPASIWRSSGAASIECAAISKIFSFIFTDALCAAPL